MWYGLKQDGIIVTIEKFQNEPTIFDFALTPNGISSWRKYEIVKVKIEELCI